MRALLVIVALLTSAFVSLAEAEVTQKGNLRLTFGGEIVPKKLPREGSAPVKVSVSAEIASVKAGKSPPQLRTISIAINRYGVLDGTGLPVCEVDDIQPATTANALRGLPRLLGRRRTLQRQSPLARAGAFPLVRKDLRLQRHL